MSPTKIFIITYPSEISGIATDRCANLLASVFDNIPRCRIDGTLAIGVM